MLRALFTQLSCSILLLMGIPFVGIAQIGELQYINEEPEGYEGSHKVMPGESLYGIARQHGISLETLMALNQLDTHTIYPGQRLIVKQPEAAATMRTRGLVESSSSVRPPMNGYADLERRQYYRVQEDETLEDIARKFRIHPNRLKDWNAISQVFPGQTLVVDKWVEQVNMYDLRGREASASLRTTRGQVEPAARVQPISNMQAFGQGPFETAEDSYRSYRTNETTTPAVRQVEKGEWLMDRPSHANRSDYHDQAGYRGASQRTPRPVYDQIEVSGPYEVLEDGYVSRRNAFYAYHDELPVGSNIEIKIPDNDGFIVVEIIGRMPAGSRSMVGISPAAARIIEGAGVYDQRLTLRY